MNMFQPIRSLIAALLLAPLLIACDAPAAAQQDEPTPTPLPPAPAIERPTYVVERGVIEDPLEIGGRVTPIDLQQLSFRRQGTVDKVNVRRGDQVTAGQVLAELQQDEKLEELRDAEDTLVQAQRDLESARKEQQAKIEQAQIALDEAQENLKRLLPGGPDDPVRAAQDALEEAQREAGTQSATGSEGKTGAEYALILKTEALSDTQKRLSDAFWDNEHAQKYGTNPDQPFIETEVDGKIVRKPNYLTDEQKAEYKTKLVEAERSLRDAERDLAQAVRDLDKARDAEIVGNDNATEKVQEAQRTLDDLVRGRGNKDLIAAQRAVKTAQLGLDEARAATLNSATKAVEDGQRKLEKASKAVEDGRIVATQPGEVISIAIGEGDTVEERQQVLEVADPTRLEVGTELSGEQMRRLQEGQLADITLLARPDVVMPASIRRMPEPYGTGGSGLVDSRDRRTLFEISDFKGQQLESGQNVKIRIVLERKENVLFLPPDAIRSFEGRRFVIIRDGEVDRRVTIKTGIETEERVEIVEGVEEGDLIVGQ